MSRYVLDNAITMAWCFADEATHHTEVFLARLSNLTDIAVVPALWMYEVMNVSMLAVRKGRISKPKALTFLDNLANLPIEIEPLASLTLTFPIISNLMEQHRLTAYDAAYLELAIRKQLPLATLDRELIRACKIISHPLLNQIQ